MRISISTIIASTFFILLAFSILAILHGFNIGVVVGIDLSIFSAIFLVYGSIIRREKIFYMFWGFLTLVLAISIIISSIYGFIYGLIIFLIGIGLLILFIGMHKS